MPDRIAVLLFSLLLATLSGTGRAAEPVALYESLRVRSAAVGEQREINVYLPPGYHTCRQRRYPVLYLPDGGVAEDFPHVISTVHRLIRQGAIRPLLVVGIENTDRRHDMTGPTQVPADLEIAGHPGGSERFRQFIGGELVPLITRRYRVTDESAIMGESLAGLFIVETLLATPDLFDTYIALDPSLWWNAGALIQAAAQRLPELAGTPARLLLAAGGTQGNAAGTAKLAAELSRHAPPSLRWEYQEHPDLRHDTIYRALKAPLLEAAFGRDPDESLGCLQGR